LIGGIKMNSMIAENAKTTASVIAQSGMEKSGTEYYAFLLVILVVVILLTTATVVFLLYKILKLKKENDEKSPNGGGPGKMITKADLIEVISPINANISVMNHQLKDLTKRVDDNFERQEQQFKNVNETFAKSVRECHGRIDEHLENHSSGLFVSSRLKGAMT